MMFVAGVPNRFLGKLAASVVPVVVLMVGTIVFAPERITFIKDYQKARLLSSFGLGDRKEMEAANYNVNQSLIYVG